MRKVRDLETKYSLLEKSTREKDRWIERVLQAFREESIAGLLEQPNQEQVNRTLLDTLRRPPIASRIDSEMLTTPSRGFGDATTESTSEGKTSLRGVSIKDEALLEHLLAQYFTWVHPVHMLFDEHDFMSSFRSGNWSHYGPMVNAMCAVGCCYLSNGNDPDMDPKMLGERFCQEAWSEVRVVKQMTLPSVVTYAILFLFELSQGLARNASSHLKLAVESLPSVDRSCWTKEAFQVSQWGIQTLNT